MAAARKAFQQTKVQANQTKGEIRDLLVKYGATQFAILEEAQRAVIGFSAHGRTVRIEVALPDRSLSARSPAGSYLAPGTPAALAAHDQEERRLWRAVKVWIFGQLEAIASGIRTFESAFLADTVLPTGQTFHEWAEPQIQQHSLKGWMPALVPGLVGALTNGEENNR